jgi:hypothetical protein
MTIRAGNTGIAVRGQLWLIAALSLIAAMPASAQVGRPGKGHAHELQPPFGSPCCALTGIDQAAGTATAKDKATGGVITFAVADPALLRSLKVGQLVYAESRTGQVSVNGAEVCCSIVSGVVTPVGPAPVKPGPAQLQPAAAEPCCSVVANSALSGSLGRLLIAFPAVVGRTRVKIYKSGQQNAIKSGVGSMAVELLPGSYVVSISNKRVQDVMIQAGHDTQVRVGVLRISAAGDTQVKVVDADQKTSLSSGRGARAVGLPVGTFGVMVAGQVHPVQIQEGQITDF